VVDGFSQGKDAGDDELGEGKRSSTEAPKRPSLDDALRDIQALTTKGLNPMYHLPKITSEADLASSGASGKSGTQGSADAAGTLVSTEDKARGGVGYAVYREFSWYASHFTTVLVAVLVLGGNGLQLTQVGPIQ
jgi:hypothetical protein